jgi:hypothetical protein
MERLSMHLRRKKKKRCSAFLSEGTRNVNKVSIMSKGTVKMNVQFRKKLQSDTNLSNFFSTWAPKAFDTNISIMLHGGA